MKKKALITLCFILLHTCWSITLYLSLSIKNPKSFQLWISVVIVVGSHLFVSGIVSLSLELNYNFRLLKI